uniref:Membrane protein of ER body-like protein n=1 Tax=Kalanchoe fedtschenkoi TaxID=63787 RepID=A0A7N0RE89_KALFE
MPIKDAETEPVYHSLESVQADGSYHLTLDSTSGNGDVTTRNHNEKGHHIQNYSSEELGVIYEGDPEPIDYDVEGVLKKQETHDLICPNCNCCITRGVRLKKRKRVPKDTHPSAKRDRIEEDTGTVDGALGESLTIRGEDTASDLQVITCWSCFSLLIPTGKGFRLFRLFGGRKQPEPEVISESDSIQTPLPTPGGGRILMDPISTVNPLQLADGNMEGQKTDINPATKKKDDVRILIEYEVKQIDPSGTEEITRDIGIPITGTQAPVREPVVRVGEARDWDILKSIVYGGLIESITSLGVVASAAGAETATLNIVVLGLANLIGGLILIFHNLKDLRKSAYEEPSNQVDRYHEVLGRRSNFKLHSVIVVLSFLIFGLIPIATYAFTFRKSDNRDYKSLAVIGASLISVTLLSLGKAHTKNPPRPASSYFKSISYYLTIAISASGLSYVAGKLLNELIEKTGWFDTTSSLNSITFPATVMPSQRAWGSY